jgi:hypothetical protein
MPFTCSICGEESTRICARCTKDACDNHLCEKCVRCSDCCECEVRLSEPVRTVVRAVVAEAAVAPEFEPLGGPESLAPPIPIPEPEPEPPLPGPTPDPEPDTDPQASAPEDQIPESAAPEDPSAVAG